MSADGDDMDPCACGSTRYHHAWGETLGAYQDGDVVCDDCGEREPVQRRVIPPIGGVSS